MARDLLGHYPPSPERVDIISTPCSLAACVKSAGGRRGTEAASAEGGFEVRWS